jgi:hypothetical protein
MLPTVLIIDDVIVFSTWRKHDGNEVDTRDLRSGTLYTLLFSIKAAADDLLIDLS